MRVALVRTESTTSRASSFLLLEGFKLWFGRARPPACRWLGDCFILSLRAIALGFGAAIARPGDLISLVKKGACGGHEAMAGNMQGFATPGLGGMGAYERAQCAGAASFAGVIKLRPRTSRTATASGNLSVALAPTSTGAEAMSSGSDSFDFGGGLT